MSAGCRQGPRTVRTALDSLQHNSRYCYAYRNHLRPRGRSRLCFHHGLRSRRRLLHPGYAHAFRHAGTGQARNGQRPDLRLHQRLQPRLRLRRRRHRGSCVRRCGGRRLRTGPALGGTLRQIMDRSYGLGLHGRGSRGRRHLRRRSRHSLQGPRRHAHHPRWPLLCGLWQADASACARLAHCGSSPALACLPRQ